MEWDSEGCRFYTESLRKSVKINYRPWAKLIAEDLAGKCDEARIADIAGGPGYMCHEIHKLMPNARFALADNFGEMLKIAAEEAQKAGMEIETFQCPAESLKLEDDSCDAAVCKQFFHEAKDVGKSVQEIFRVLKPGGKAYLIDFDADGSKGAAKKVYWFLRATANKRIADWYMHNFERGLSNMAIQSAMKDAGFREVTYLPKGPNYYVTGVK